MTQNFIDRPLHAVAIARTQKHVQEDVVGLEHGVRFEFAAPVAVRMLQAEKPVLSLLDAVDHMVQAKIHSPETRLRGRFRCGVGYRPRIDG